MTLENFCRGIGLEKAAFEELKKISITEEEYSLYKKLYFEDREKFFSVLEGKENFRLLFLYCYCRLAAEDFEYAIAEGESPQMVLPEPGFVYAPAVEGADAGWAYVLIGNKTVGKLPVVYGQTVEKTPEEEKSLWQKLLGK